MPSSSLVPVVALLGAAPVVAVVTSGPDSGDIYAVLGAFLASFLVAIISDGKSRRDVCSLVLGAATCGSFAPGLAVEVAVWRGYIPRDATLSWSVWASLGFVAGLSGWGTLHHLLDAAARWVRRWADYK